MWIKDKDKRDPQTEKLISEHGDTLGDSLEYDARDKSGLNGQRSLKPGSHFNNLDLKAGYL